MKKFFSKILITFTIVLLGGILNACIDKPDSEVSKKGKTTHNLVNKNSLPLNISIILDLSDRLIRENVQPNQMYHDTAIVNYFVDYFINTCVSKKIVGCKDNFQIFFYPEPKNANINAVADGLSVDLASLNPQQKKSALISMKKTIDENLDVIYNTTLRQKHWVGSDIWDLFTSKKVDQLCIRKGYRNIIAILSDGYLLALNNKVEKGNTFSYISSKTLQSKAKLISKRTDLKDIEVIMLEVNPYSMEQRDQLVKTLQDWFVDMGLKSKNVSIHETMNVRNTKTIIKNFLD